MSFLHGKLKTGKRTYPHNLQTAQQHVSHFSLSFLLFKTCVHSKTGVLVLIIFELNMIEAVSQKLSTLNMLRYQFNFIPCTP